MIVPIILTEEENDAINEAFSDALIDTPMWVFHLMALGMFAFAGWTFYMLGFPTIYNIGSLSIFGLFFYWMVK